MTTMSNPIEGGNPMSTAKHSSKGSSRVASQNAVQTSYDRCSASNGFFDTFYDIFLAKSPEVAAKFAQTDFPKQKKLLKASLFLLVRFGTCDDHPPKTIERIGESHSRQHLDVPPVLYDLWLDSLCEAIQQHDSQYTEELERLWREQMRGVIALITDRY